MESLAIDGSLLEGGGSILRLSSGFSVLKQIPIRVKNIRANRPKPGLRLQHLRGLQILEKLTGGHLSKSTVGTTEIEFSPGDEFKENLIINIETAGNVALLLQPVQIACMRLDYGKRINIEIKGGGTFGKWAPGTSFLTNVLFKIYEQVGYKINLKIIRHGFYPKGGAHLYFTIIGPAQPIKPIEIVDLGNVSIIKGQIICAEFLKKPQVTERIKRTIETELKQKLNLESSIFTKYVKTYSTGVGICLWAESDTKAIISSGTILGERGVSSEKVGKHAANAIISYIKNKIPVDNYLADQLIPVMSIANGESRIRVSEITSHLKTNLELLQKFNLKEYKILKESNGIIVNLKQKQI